MAKVETYTHLMEKEEGKNQTSVTEFVLMGFGNHPELQILFFLLFLVIYIVITAANTLIVVLVVTDWHLHAPMYFFLRNLSCLEICCNSTILPRMLASFLTGDRTISVTGCIVQFYLFGFLVTTECYLLAVMSYDRYLAICKPLHYVTRINGIYIVTMAANMLIVALVVADQHLHTPIYVIWREQKEETDVRLMEKGEGENQTSVTEFILLGFENLPELRILFFLLFLVIYVVTMAANMLIVALVLADQHLHTPMYFFLGNLSCLEICYTSTILPRLLASLLTAVIKLSCSNTSLVTLVTLIFSSIDTVPPFLLTLTSYAYIISTILRIPSTTGRQKAFSTCSSHLIVVTIFYMTLITVYMLPNTGALRAPNKVFSVLYTVLTPLINPLIYSLRNKEVKEALRRALQKRRL
ncbi:olfactory receptor 5A1-like [Gopherus flavomarginatus]|uniref:olfactory receptor 5A1-like n=1 Tax=Gopherus flavomarginatus TaxID=286002 RepID=UPI0021CC3A87|nr:olfactory receptor 5A1-like [Gopherus flavomarginatus]